jgi:hypothetical protein
MACIVYRSALDGVPHTWIIEFLELLGVNNKINPLLRKILVRANKMRLYAEEKLTERKVQQYTVEYFKETHYLSALLLLYISLIPLTELLIRLNTGYEETLYHTDW